MARSKINTLENLHIWLDGDDHDIGAFSEPNVHGVKTAMCKGCRGLVVLHADGKVDPERFMLAMSCKSARLIHVAVDAVLGAAPPSAVEPVKEQLRECKWCPYPRRTHITDLELCPESHGGQSFEPVEPPKEQP
jgi:hypothetical protein